VIRDVDEVLQAAGGDLPERVGASIVQAMLGGFRSDRVAWAFLAGYQAAIFRMFPGQEPMSLASFSVTEASGNRPRDILTRVEPIGTDQLRVNGSKSWVAAGPACDHLMVAAVMQPDAEAKRRQSVQWPEIRMLVVPAGAGGVNFHAARPQPFIPELPHTGVDLDEVTLPVSALEPGDGYAGFVKPFRSAEDVHIAIAMLAYLVRCGREYQWPREQIEEMVALLAGLSGTASMGLDQPATHIALGGLLPAVNRVYARVDQLWNDTLNAGHAGVAARVERWQRDQKLFGMAKQVRQLRLTRAWDRLEAVTSPGTGGGTPG
jgi:hypothetical protein